MHKMIYLNGWILPLEEARISPVDHGFTVGDGVFESLITYQGKPFAMRQHWERLVRSAGVMGLAVPSLEELTEATNELISANNVQHGRIRITLTGGEAPLGSEKGSNPQTTLVIASMELPQRPPLAKVITVDWTRNERSALTQVKSTSYGENVVALSAAKAAGAQEAIFANTKGELCEGTGSNIFLIRGGQIHTPALSSGCLAGVTRGLVLECCERLGFSVDESPLPLNSLFNADEAFLTSTYREIQPIAQVNDHSMPIAPGVITTRLQAAFQELVRAGE